MSGFAFQRHDPFALEEDLFLRDPSSCLNLPLPPPQPGFFSGDTSFLPSTLSGFPAASSSSSETMPSPAEKKRKQTQSGDSAQFNDADEAKRRKRRKSGSPAKEVAAAAAWEFPAGYIHVRARRGEATDSHSLAERARRGKISEKMRTLQSLVPGCDKVIGKALMLDEIINYVQYLRNQVEFLSFKLDALNPVFFSSYTDLDHLIKLENVEMPPAPPPAPQPSPFFDNGDDDRLVQESSAALVFLHGQGPHAFPQEGERSYAMQLGDQMRGLLHQVELGICPFQ
ncbi:unnamed protein product [Spirodela intermedia]|uniref:BHLH domain-containing protein n=1 Tax=Spirodela intermedia TaxID=51605 RepID=A0A7I8L590_SPIIN|nr:unnamed protein product [Spirodela intermedia]